jgi:hypothetical protein
MEEKIEESFAELYCKENGIKPTFCEASMEYNSSEIKVRYVIEGEEAQCKTIGVKEALDLISKYNLKLEKRLEDIETKFVLFK